MEPSNSNFNVHRTLAEKMRLELKREWKLLWNDKYDDEKIAEGVSIRNYSQLYVEQGQVIYASRDCKSLDFYEILEKKLGQEYSNKISPPPRIGGWRKFAKENLPKKRTVREKPKIKVDLKQPQRKNGRGWKNQIRINKKIRECTENYRY